MDKDEPSEKIEKSVSSVNIQIIDDYYIRSDSNQWKLSKKYIIKGKETWKSLGYYSDLRFLIRNLIELSLRETNITSLQELISKTVEIKSQLKQVLDELMELDNKLKIDFNKHENN